MASERVERRLTAILAADVAGYSRLTSAAEEDTHVRLKEHLRVLIDPKITEYRGRVVKNTGDGLLAEFSSVVDAVRCAVEIQRAMAERNAEVQEDKRIEFRIGVNIGDVIIDGGTAEPRLSLWDQLKIDDNHAVCRKVWSGLVWISTGARRRLSGRVSKSGHRSSLALIESAVSRCSKT
jgi:hypothetical protein